MKKVEIRAEILRQKAARERSLQDPLQGENDQPLHEGTQQGYIDAYSRALEYLAEVEGPVKPDQFASWAERADHMYTSLYAFSGDLGMFPDTRASESRRYLLGRAHGMRSALNYLIYLTRKKSLD